MKIKVEVDIQDIVDDMLCDECTDLNDRVKDDITRSVVRKVTEQFQSSIDKLLSEKLTPRIQSLVDEKVMSTLDDLIEVGEMSTRSGKVLIKDHVKDLFEKNNGWNSPESKIKEIAKKFGDEMKLQYSNCFAMNIVKNLSEQGLLNDDVAKALLAPPAETK